MAEGIRYRMTFHEEESGEIRTVTVDTLDKAFEVIHNLLDNSKDDWVMWSFIKHDETGHIIR